MDEIVLACTLYHSAYLVPFFSCSKSVFDELDSNYPIIYRCILHRENQPSSLSAISNVIIGLS